MKTANATPPPSSGIIAATMTNHPNRNWRARMYAAADQFLESDQGRAIVGQPKDPADLAARRQAARESFVNGYEAGRASNQRPRPPER